jgi:hypothetical protein
MTQDTSTATKKKRGSIHKVAAIDIGIAEQVFKNALHLLIPEDAKQRKVFESLMPYLFVLRNKGCSWEQLTTLLNECGFKLQPSTVRNYFSEMHQVNRDLYREKMNEQAFLLNEVKKQTKAVDISSIAGQISDMMDKQRMAAVTKVQALFGGQLAGMTPTLVGMVPALENQPAVPASIKNPEPASPARQKTGAGLVPAPEQQEKQNSLAMLKVTSTDISAIKNGFFDLGDETAIPAIAPSKADVAASKLIQVPAPEATRTCQNLQLKCKPLIAEVKPLMKRANLPPEVYTDVSLAHPAIRGLMLTMAERMYGAALEYVDDNGEILTESLHEKRFRIMWQKPVTPTPSTTSKDFTDINPAYFKNNS